MKLGNCKDKWGYYQIGDFKTYSKIEAIELSTISGKFPEWRFNDLDFSAYDWTKEPLKSLPELYADRARQLRDHYDHIVIFYSGGIDSENIIDTFVSNGIKFEEIATMNYHSIDPDPDSYFNAEQIKVSYPKISALQKQGIQFRHRWLDISDISKQVLSEPKYRLDRGYYNNSHWGTSVLGKSYIRDVIPDYQKMAEQGKKVVFVWGSDKPRVFMDQGRFCVKFIDIVDNGISPRTQMLGREWEYDELFYWAPECADIICKQAHIIKNFVTKHKIYLDEHKDSYSKMIDIPSVNEMFGQWMPMKYMHLVNCLIYPNFKIDRFSNGKRTLVIYSHRDKPFHQREYWRDTIDRLAQHLRTLNPRWLNDPNDINQGLVGIVSPSYFLEKEIQ
jgi:hypothetical protein